ncbi:hypothetical protein JCM19238_3123 [Vibrio ponticus]|nr:hypothetical protein JCM19238_3123 [Vibrio ponticus]
MKVAFLHTLAANQTLFDDCIQESQLAKFADVCIAVHPSFCSTRAMWVLMSN